MAHINNKTIILNESSSRLHSRLISYHMQNQFSFKTWHLYLSIHLYQGCFYREIKTLNWIKGNGYWIICRPLSIFVPYESLNIWLVSLLILLDIWWKKQNVTLLLILTLFEDIYLCLRYWIWNSDVYSCNNIIQTQISLLWYPWDIIIEE